MVEATCFPGTHAVLPEVENRLDRAFQIFWEKLEALLFLTDPEAVPETGLHAHPHQVKREEAQTPPASKHPGGWRQRDNHKQREIIDQPGGNTSTPTALQNKRTIARTHISPSSCQLDSGDPTPGDQTHNPVRSSANYMYHKPSMPALQLAQLGQISDTLPEHYSNLTCPHSCRTLGLTPGLLWQNLVWLQRGIG
ncbi:Hypothetical predicted protein [Pelobates cultripes]|uniref:Uncharacterized protein n=1 Tax=Pelobates cultripes TaxID=61616 RepID=A0AAD1RRR4_PELCU|nr:Hypothetical predicted protein [Pelobates cultripes]